MSTPISNLISTKILSNLDTYVYTVLKAGLHLASIEVNALPPSGITLTIKQNSTTIASTSAPAAAQQAINLSATMDCAINDTISVVIASSTASDELPNAFKGLLNIHRGSSN